MDADLHFREALVTHGGAEAAPDVPVLNRTAFSPRRILLYGLNYSPELTGIGKYTGEMAQWLARAGHEIRVVTAPPYYPYWKVQPGYRGWGYTREMVGGMRVYRAPLWVPKVPGGTKRVLHLASFAISSLPLLLRNILFWRPHVLWCVAPALVCAPGAALAARLCGALAWLHIQDLEIDAAFELGLLRGKAIRERSLASERALFRAFDRVSSISPHMVDKLREKGVSAGRALLFPNWVDTDAIRPMPSTNSFRRSLGIPDSAFVALYSGTMGAKQGLELMAAAARRLVGEQDIHFLFCGQGAGRQSLRAACEGLPRVHWLPLQPAERLSELLSTANVHLLPQLRDADGLVLPSKMTGMLASGRPVVATADIGTELAWWVKDCGCVVAPGDDEGFAKALLGLSQSPERCHTLGGQARQRAVERLSRDVILSNFVAAMEGAIEDKARAGYAPASLA